MLRTAERVSCVMQTTKCAYGAARSFAMPALFNGMAFAEERTLGLS
jgi:hypothetical protein